MIMLGGNKGMKKKIVLLLAMLMILAVPMTSLAKDAEITKAQFLKDVLEAADVKVEEVNESDLADTIDAQYIPYVEAAYKKDIISDDEKLNTDKLITKEEAVIILVKVFGERVKLKNITQEMINEEMKFSDNDSIKPLSKQYITYALKNNMIKKNKNAFYPLMVLTEKTSKDMIQQAKKAQEKYFVRKGLSAGDMLVEADKKLRELKTYKADGKLEMNMKMNVEGLPADDELGQDLLNQGVNMDMDLILDMQVENPDKVYVKEVIKSNIDNPEAGLVDTENVIEIFMDKEIMYQKMTLTGDKWIKNDMSSIYGKLQSLQGSSPQNMSQLSGEQLEFFKDYAWYSDDEEIDGKEYYVVNADIDKEAYKKFFKEYAKKIMEATLEQQEQMNSLDEEAAAAAEMTKMFIGQMIEKMDIEISYKFYIDKETMNYEKMWMSQNVYMNMDQLISMMAEMSEEEEDTDLSNVKVEMVTHVEGEFDYKDFDGEVVFPVIKSEDIFQMGDTIMPQN